MVHILKRQTDLVLIKEKDYIRVPKPNGYRSYHLEMCIRDRARAPGLGPGGRRFKSCHPDF